jgi:cysteine desulfurase
MASASHPGKSKAEADREESSYAYLDANATTMMPQVVIDTMVEYSNRGNASAEYQSARDSRKMMDNFRQYIANQCGFELEGPDGYTVLFGSGGSEANCHIIAAAVRAFAHKTGRLPHLVVSATEHKSVLSCALRLAKEKLTQLTVVPVRTTGEELGTVDPNAVERAIRPNTCLVSVMAANNETGIANDIAMIGVACMRARVPFHTDAVQFFGKSFFHPKAARVDAFSISFHKIHGPPGVGALVVKNSLLEGYDLCSLVCGTQNSGLRGGTENIPGIAASFAATKLTFTGRADKTTKMAKLREAIRAALGTRFPTFYLDDYRGGRALAAVAKAEKGGPAVVVWIAPKDPTRVLPGVLFLSVYRPKFCNRSTRAALEKRDVIVSLGSACSSADQGSSATVDAMGLPEELRSGVLRVSLGDDSTAADVKKFVKAFVAVVESKECTLRLGFA